MNINIVFSRELDPEKLSIKYKIYGKYQLPDDCLLKFTVSIIGVRSTLIIVSFASSFPSGMFSLILESDIPLTAFIYSMLFSNECLTNRHLSDHLEKKILSPSLSRLFKPLIADTLSLT